MPTAIRKALTTTALLGLICIIGCGPKKTTEYGVAQSDISWTTNVTDPVPGIDEFSVTRVTLKAGADALPFIIWSDLPNGAAGYGVGSPRGGTLYEGRHRASNGRSFDFHAKTTDGKAGSITIAGVDYDPTKGPLFLISARQDPLKLAQISLELSAFPKSGELKGDALRDLANSNPEIRAFFEKQKKGDTNAK